MKASELKSEAETLSEHTIKEGLALACINKAINKIGDLSKIYDEIEVEAEPEVWYNLPNNFIFIEEVINLDLDEPTTNYKYVNDRIKFFENYRFKIIGTRLPDRVSNLASEVEINDLFRNAIVDYLIAYVKKQNGELEEGYAIEKRLEKEISRVGRIINKNQNSRINKVAVIR